MFEHAYDNFMLVGHTKFTFGLLKQILQRTQVGCFDNLAKIGCDSVTNSWSEKSIDSVTTSACSKSTKCVGNLKILVEYSTYFSSARHRMLVAAVPDPGK